VILKMKSMKQYLIIILCLCLIISNTTFSQNELCETCIEYTMKFTDYSFHGSSFQLAGYDITMNLPSDFSVDRLTKENLFSCILSKEIKGEFIAPNGESSEIRYSLIPYKDTITILMKTSNGWYPWDKIAIKDNELIFSYDYWYCPPASIVDIDIIDLCFTYLNDSSKWQQSDDRICDDDEAGDTWSLFCAIKAASIEKTGEYNHRGKVVQTTRFVIDELYPNHGYAHTLMDFNNDSKTSFSDILQILNIVKERIETELIRTK